MSISKSPPDSFAKRGSALYIYIMKKFRVSVVFVGVGGLGSETGRQIHLPGALLPSTSKSRLRFC